MAVRFDTGNVYEKDCEIASLLYFIRFIPVTIQLDYGKRPKMPDLFVTGPAV